MFVHGSHTWFHVHPDSNGPCCGENRPKTCAIGHGRRKTRPNDHSVCNPGQKMESAHNGMETVLFGRKCYTWHPHMELCPFGMSTWQKSGDVPKRPKNMKSGSMRRKRVKNGRIRPPEVMGGLGFRYLTCPDSKTGQFLSPDMLSRPITGISGNPPKLYTRKAEKFPELLGSENAPRV